MKSFQILFMLFAVLCMSTMIKAENHTMPESDVGMVEDDMDMDTMGHNDTMGNSTDGDMDGDRDIPVSAAGRIGAMASVAAIVAGTFAF